MRSLLNGNTAGVLSKKGLEIESEQFCTNQKVQKQKNDLFSEFNPLMV